MLSQEELNPTTKRDGDSMRDGGNNRDGDIQGEQSPDLIPTTESGKRVVPLYLLQISTILTTFVL